MSKTFRETYRAAIEVLDRPGLRIVLKLLSNAVVRARHSGNRILYRDGFWMHRVGEHLVVDGRRFWYPRTIGSRPNEEIRKLKERPKDYWFHFYSPEPGDVIVDIGAGKGEDALVFSQAVGDTGRVFAIEALPSTFSCLEYFLEINGINNVTPIQVAISDKNGVVNMTDDEIRWLSNSLGGRGTVANSKAIKTVTLDRFVSDESIERIDFLKMNIEGAERAALQGMTNSLKIVKNICISCHDFRADRGDGEFFRTMKAVRDYLQEAGYHLLSRETDRRPYIACQVLAKRLD